MNLRDALRIDPARVSDEICAKIVAWLAELRRRGAVVGLSGGVDSSVVASLCVRALGKDRVLGLYMPEKDSSPDSLRLGRDFAKVLGIESKLEDITGILEAAGCYTRRDAAIRSLFPNYDASYRCKLVLPNLLDGGPYQLFHLIVRPPEGAETKVRLPLEAYLAIVAATNFKQRTRAMIEYFHADRLHYAVAGTPNRIEFDQGFFVKTGDGAADMKPIAHLYKSQVYQLAEYLGVPDEVRSRRPTTDTYPLEQSQEEFYFSLPIEDMDVALYACNSGIASKELCGALGVTEEQAARIYSQIEKRRKAARYLHLPPLMMF